MIDITIADILIVLFMAWIVHSYIALFGTPRRDHPVLQAGAWIAYLCFEFLVMGTNSAYPLMNLTGNILFMTLLFKLGCGKDFKTSFFHICVFCAAWMAIEVATHSFLLFVTPDTEDTYILGSVTSQIITYIAVQAYGRFIPKRMGIPLPLRCWLELFIVPVVSIYVIYDAYVRSLTHGSDIAFIVVSLLMIFMNLIIFDVYERMMSHAMVERQNLIYAQGIEMYSRQADDREAAYQQTRALRHDLNDRLIGIDALLEAGQSGEAVEEIRRMLAENKLHKDEVSHSGNLALDALINYKHSYAASKGILLECRTEVPADLFVDGTDLCIILGNLLDNALEAVENLPAEQRRIRLEARLEKDVLHIMIENPYSGKIVKNADGTIKSSKGPGELHGYGLASVNRTVQKYNGGLILKYDDAMFRASVILYHR